MHSLCRELRFACADHVIVRLRWQRRPAQTIVADGSPRCAELLQYRRHPEALKHDGWVNERKIKSGLDDGYRLSLGDYVVDLDEQRFKFSRSRGGDGNFHLHRLNEGDIVAVTDACSGLD